MTLRRLGLAAALLASLGVSASAQVFVNNAPATIGGVTLFVWNGQNISATNPVPVNVVSGGSGGGGGATGSVTAAGTNGTLAQAVQGINGGVPVPVTGTFWQTTQPVSLASQPLPTGAATATNQSSEIAALGAPTDAAYSGTGAGSLVSINKAQLTALQAPTPAGTAIIGRVGIDQTTPGATNAVSIFGLNTVGTQQALSLDARGGLISPNAGAANRQITKCSVAATSATLSCTIGNGTTVSSPAGICPAVTNPVTTEVRTSVALLGVGLNGQTLTTATDGTAAGSPDMILPAANALYTLTVGATNAITAYNPSASAAVTTCIQTLRQ